MKVVEAIHVPEDKTRNMTIDSAAKMLFRGEKHVHYYGIKESNTGADAIVEWALTLPKLEIEEVKSTFGPDVEGQAIRDSKQFFNDLKMIDKPAAKRIKGFIDAINDRFTVTGNEFEFVDSNRPGVIIYVRTEL